MVTWLKTHAKDHASQMLPQSLSRLLGEWGDRSLGGPISDFLNHFKGARV